MNVALAKWMTGDTAEARPLIAASRKIMPRDPYIIQTEGEILAYSGEHDKGLALMEASVRYEPRVPIGFKMGMAEGYYLARNYQEALRIYDSVIDMPWYAALLRSVCLGQLGRVEVARHAASSALAIAPPAIDPTVFARNVSNMCVLKEDADHWSEGFRKVGIET